MLEFTSRAKKVLNEFAREEAKKLGCENINVEHIFLGLLREEDSVAVKIIKNISENSEKIKKKVETIYKEKTSKKSPKTQRTQYRKILANSKEEAEKLKHDFVGTEHVLLAILREPPKYFEKILSVFNINYETVKEEILRILGNHSSKLENNQYETQFILGRNSSSDFKSYPNKSPSTFLEEFGKDLTKLAKQSKIDPIIGRESEIQRLIQVICRKTKNNPVLVGESGVGKTAVVEGLAIAIVEKKIPDLLFDKKVISLDLASLVAGTKYRGEFEERIKKILREVENSNNIIIFIDEIHTIIGAGSSEGSVDAANILKPALSRGEIQCIGATTISEYRKYIEKDSALERRFQMVKVEEPSIENTIKILKGLKKSYEDYHRVVYSDEALEKAVQLSARYINDRYLPDKAIDIIDEVGAKSRLNNCKKTEKILKLENELSHLLSEEEKVASLQKYENAIKIRNKARQKEQELKVETKKWEKGILNKSIFITDEDIFSIVSSWTNIPLTKIEKEESENLLNIENTIKEKIIGQDQAIEKISRSLRIARTGFKDENRPTGSFIFLGPTGVGKTELAKVFANFLFNSKDKILRIDMSEYMEPHSISRLIGSPPGYVGYGEGGQLTEFVRKNPYCIVLLDEIEKAHKDIFNILLQIMEEGNLTDAKGIKINFKDTILIITSNIGADILQNTRLGFDFSTSDKEQYKNEKLKEELKKFFKPEFLNRLDDIVYFNSLSRDSILKIIEILIKNYNEKIKHKNIILKFSLKAKDYILKKGYNEKYGARALRRVFYEEIEDYLAIRSLKGDFKTKTTICVDFSKEKDSLNFVEKVKEEGTIFIT